MSKVIDLIKLFYKTRCLRKVGIFHCIKINIKEIRVD